MALAGKHFQIQLINEKGVLDVMALETFAKQVKLAGSGISYSVVSIIGPQSSGKSTLLNHLFGTKFREMDARKGRCQTTKGIWLANYAGNRRTVVMDLEGTDSGERGVDDTAFEKKTALFALALSNIMIINMWCHDIGREHAANKSLLRTVFKVMGKLLGFHKKTLLFVIRDKTRSPMDVLERNLLKDIEQIWKSFDKQDGHKLDRSFNVKIVALPNYEEKEDEFKKKVATIRKQYFSSNKLGKSRDGREVASGFSCSVQHTWEVITENKDLDLPSLEVMMATVRCERIAKEKLASFKANEKWLKLKKDVRSQQVPKFGKELNSIIDIYLKEYDVVAEYFDEGVRTEKRRQLEIDILRHVKPAYKCMLKRIRSRILKEFEKKLNGSKEFDVEEFIKPFMTEYDKECKDALVKRANWDTKRDELRDDMRTQVAAAKKAIRKPTLATGLVVGSAVVGVVAGVGLVGAAAVTGVMTGGAGAPVAIALGTLGGQIIAQTTARAVSYLNNREKKL